MQGGLGDELVRKPDLEFFAAFHAKHGARNCAVKTVDGCRAAVRAAQLRGSGAGAQDAETVRLRLRPDGRRQSSAGAQNDPTPRDEWT
jgi:hypothetical protein